MDLAPYYGWFVLIHVLAAFAFIAAHGISMGVFFALRRETDRAKLAVLVEHSGRSIGALYITFLILLAAGILAGIVGGWFTNGQLWLWAAIVVLVVIVGAMYGFMTTSYVTLRRALGVQSPQDIKKGLVPEPASDEELASLLASPRPTWGAIIGIAGLAVVIWLMEMKPF